MDCPRKRTKDKVHAGIFAMVKDIFLLSLYRNIVSFQASFCFITENGGSTIEFTMYLRNFPCIKYLKLGEPHGPLALFFHLRSDDAGSDFYRMFIRSLYNENQKAVT